MAKIGKIRLGIWGVQTSGKTVYMVRLLKILQEQGWTFQALDQNSLDFYNDNHRRIVNGYYPEATSTAISKTIDVYSYLIEYQDPRTNEVLKQAELNFIDIGGEFYRNKDYWYDENIRVGLDEKELPIIDYLLSCHGILFLLDLKKDQDRYNPQNNIRLDRDDEKLLSQYQILDNLFQQMQLRRKKIDNHSGKLEPFVAFAVTKADSKDIFKYIRDDRLSSMELVEKALGKQVDITWFNQYFHVNLNELKKQKQKGAFHPISSKKHRCQFYSISAIGFYYDKKDRCWKSGGEDIASNQEFNSDTQQDIDESQPYTPFPKPQQTRDTSSSRDDIFEDDFDSILEPEEPPQIKQGVKLKTLNVVEPIEWFIDGINRCKNDINLPEVPDSSKENPASQAQ